MGYVIAAILVVLIVAAGVTFFVLGADAQRSGPAAIAAPDSTQTRARSEHADEHAGRADAGRAAAMDRRDRPGRRAGEGGLGGEAEGSRARPARVRAARRPAALSARANVFWTHRSVCVKASRGD